MESQPCDGCVVATIIAWWWHSQLSNTHKIGWLCESGNAIDLSDCTGIRTSTQLSHWFSCGHVSGYEKRRRNGHESAHCRLHRSSRLCSGNLVTSTVTHCVIKLTYSILSVIFRQDQRHCSDNSLERIRRGADNDFKEDLMDVSHFSFRVEMPSEPSKPQLSAMRTSNTMGGLTAAATICCVCLLGIICFSIVNKQRFTWFISRAT